MDAKVEKGEHQWPIMQEGRIFVQSVQNSLRQRWLFFYFEVGSTIYIQNHFNFVFEDDKCAVRKKTYMLKLFNFNILFVSNEGLQMPLSRNTFGFLEVRRMFFSRWWQFNWHLLFSARKLGMIFHHFALRIWKMGGTKTTNQEKPWLFRVYFREYITQLCGDYFINHDIRIPMQKQTIPIASMYSTHV